MSDSTIDCLLYLVNDAIESQLMSIQNHFAFKEMERHWNHILLLTDTLSGTLLLLQLQNQECISHTTYLNKLIYDNYFNKAGAIPLSLLLCPDMSPTELRIINSTITRAFLPTVIDTSAPYLSDFCYSSNSISNPNHIPLVNMVLFCRFVHCIKIMLRNKIGRFSTQQDYTHFFQHWIHQYCSQNEYNIQTPLKSAVIHISQTKQHNSYQCQLRLTLHRSAIVFEQTLLFQED